jgi:hypothetical protein
VKGRALVKYTHVLRTVNVAVVTGNCVFVGNLHRNTMTEHVYLRAGGPFPLSRPRSNVISTPDGEQYKARMTDLACIIPGPLQDDAQHLLLILEVATRIGSFREDASLKSQDT